MSDEYFVADGSNKHVDEFIDINSKIAEEGKFLEKQIQNHRKKKDEAWKNLFHNLQHDGLIDKTLEYEGHGMRLHPDKRQVFVVPKGKAGGIGAFLAHLMGHLE